MSGPTVIPPAGGEVVGDSPDLHVHCRHSDLFYVLEGELTIRLGAEDRAVAVPAGTLARVPPLVVHGFRNRTDAQLGYTESFYVLEGELALRAGDRELRAGAGSWVQVPPGVPHAVTAAGRYLDIHTPGCGFGAFLRDGGADFDQQPAPTLGPWTPSASRST